MAKVKSLPAPPEGPPNLVPVLKASFAFPIPIAGRVVTPGDEVYELHPSFRTVRLEWNGDDQTLLVHDDAPNAPERLILVPASSLRYLVLRGKA